MAQSTSVFNTCSWRNAALESRASEARGCHPFLFFLIYEYVRSTYTFSVRINLSLDIQLSNLMMSYDEPLTISAGCRDYIELSKTPENYQGQEFLIS